MPEDDAGHGVLGPLEAAVMTTVWRSEEPVSVRDVLDVLNRSRAQPLAYTTVMTTLARLAEKGVLERELRGRGYVYRAVVSDAAAIAVRNVVRDFGGLAVAHFVEEARSDPALLRRLNALLDEG
ncbi:MAG: BlaI/MecI/CopY family transcriptional regulator [Acidimicrobiales bacterium]